MAEPLQGVCLARAGTRQRGRGGGGRLPEPNAESSVGSLARCGRGAGRSEPAEKVRAPGPAGTRGEVVLPAGRLQAPGHRGKVAPGLGRSGSTVKTYSDFGRELSSGEDSLLLDGGAGGRGELQGLPGEGGEKTQGSFGNRGGVPGECATHELRRTRRHGWP